MLIPSPCIKITSEPFTLKVRRPHVSDFSDVFSSNKRGWRLRTFSFLGRRTLEPRVALPPKGRLRQLATSLGTVFIELGLLIFCAKVVFSLSSVSLFLYVLV